MGKIGDPSAIKSDRESFKARIAEAYPETKPGALPLAAGQIFRFIHEPKVGDVVVYPSKHDRQVNIANQE
jgi:restriction system protein